MCIRDRNWRGVFAGPGLSKAGQERLEKLIAAMVASPSWKSAIAHRRWNDLYLGAVPFRDFLEAEHSRWSAPPKTTQLPAVAPRTTPNPTSTERPLATYVLVGAALAAGILAFRSHARRGGIEAPPPALAHTPADAASPESKTPDAVAPEPLAPEPTALPPQSIPSDEVALAFEAWKLTAAERDIAELMLEGLRYKQIAGKRGTSERTVRQQAQIILKKAGLDGRADLAAHFLHRKSRRTA